MPRSTCIIEDGPVMNALRLGTARKGSACTHHREKRAVGEGEGEGYVDFVRLLNPHVTASVSLT